MKITENLCKHLRKLYCHGKSRVDDEYQDALCTNDDSAWPKSLTDRLKRVYSVFISPLSGTLGSGKVRSGSAIIDI